MGMFIRCLFHHSTLLYAVALWLNAFAVTTTALPSSLRRYGSRVETIGRGSTASVYLCEASETEIFAVKVFDAWDPKEHSTLEDYRKEILRQHSITKRVSDHDSIVQVFDLKEKDEIWFEVMEYYPQSVFAAVAQGNSSEVESECLFKQLIGAVAHVHQHGFAHRDLKLENLMMDSHGKLKLLDFGRAVLAYDFLEQKVLLHYDIIGSDPYMAPEGFRSLKYDPRIADIWSLAMVYYAMTLRQLPWERPHVSDEDSRVFVSSQTSSVSRVSIL
ncbi:HAL protein kinase [Cladophialophora psammophila CBS 110553]|uniref:non-specific serine/threonine protein kinase n=1 Tax=Cladophialophora psammophila CBS 110553 TaxID=1182543 RepID=W9XA60_9EURO|nr:HAL protein kinase [Cladophialophora psammophila CBS 110553]EXJ74225.1 HAL protein kinase [Cladophialophora psammophila CBS 110553]